MAGTSQPTRIESDSLGEVDVPADRYWGAQTQRALQNFPSVPAGDRIPMPVILALAEIKRAAAIANNELDVLDGDTSGLIAAAAEDVMSGVLGPEEFPLPVWQSGSGTQTNMNVNEVLSARANEIATGMVTTSGPVHPNDHVNRSQSSNDVFPTAIHLAVCETLRRDLVPSLDGLFDLLNEKSRSYADVLKAGRTHLQDALPMTFGQEVSGWATQIEDATSRVLGARDGLLGLAVGGTAVGTGLNAPAGFGARVAQLLAGTTGIAFVPAVNRFAGIAAHDALLHMSSALRDLAVSLAKIADDIRWLASGPRSGLGELLLPANEPGSSMMPGKVNPSQCESLLMICSQVVGNDAAATAASLRGTLQLHLAKPLLAHSVLGSVELLAAGIRSFTSRLVAGLEPDPERMRSLAERSLMSATVLAPALGYETVARVVRHAHDRDLGLKEALEELGFDPDELDAISRPDRLSGG